MNKTIRLMPLFCAMVVTRAIAGGPEASSAEQAAPRTSANDAATQNPRPAADTAVKTAADTVATTTDKPVASATDGKTVIKHTTLTQSRVNDLLSRGYKPKQRGDTVYYCRREPKLNSHFSTEICKSSAEISRDENDGREMVETMRRRTVPLDAGK